MFKRKKYRFVLLLVLLTCATTHSHAQSTHAQPTWHSRAKKSFNSKEFCKDLAILFAKDWVAKLANLFGGALVNNAFTGQPVDVTMGLPAFAPMIDNVNLFRIGEPPLTLRTFLPVGGFEASRQTDSKLKNIACSLAGPVCGALAYYFMNICSTMQKYKKHKIPWKLSKLLKESLLDADIYRHLVTNLFPRGYNSGAQILREFFPNAPTNDRFYMAGSHVLVHLFLDEKIVETIDKQLNKNAYESIKTKSYQFVDRENIKAGNRFLFSLTHKTLAAIRCANNNNDFDISRDTAFNENDAFNLALLLLYQDYFKSLQAVYGG